MGDLMEFFLNLFCTFFFSGCLHQLHFFLASTKPIFKIRDIKLNLDRYYSVLKILSKI